MRYLLLSVLVVCVIGVMVPSAFAEVHIVDIFLGEQSDECPDGICISNKNLEVEPNDIVIFQYPTYPEMERMSWEGGTHANGPYDNPLPISNGIFVKLVPNSRYSETCSLIPIPFRTASYIPFASLSEHIDGTPFLKKS